MKPIMKLTILFFLAVLTLGAQEALAATVYVAGTCKPSFRSFTHIQDALNAMPPPTTVQVCPGTYPEQITITQPVILQGIASADQDRPVITPPPGGLTQTATTSYGEPVYFQIWVNNASGAVNLSNLTMDGSGNGVAMFAGIVVGVFFQNSPGSVSRTTARNQSGNGAGFGILVEGGSANPSVSVTNNSVHDYDDVGIFSETNNTTASVLTATISGNLVDTSLAATDGIAISQGATTTVSGNFVGGPSAHGIFTANVAAGSVTGNTIIGNGNIGIQAQADGVSVTGNKIFTASVGIRIFSSVASVQGNTISDSASAGIDYECTANPNVIHNTINDAPIGINDVPSLLAVPNTYFNVDTIRSQGIC